MFIRFGIVEVMTVWVRVILVGCRDGNRLRECEVCSFFEKLCCEGE